MITTGFALVYLCATLIQMALCDYVVRHLSQREPSLRDQGVASVIVILIVFATTTLFFQAHQSGMYSDCPPLYLILPGFHILYTTHSLMNFLNIYTGIYSVDYLVFPALVGCPCHCLVTVVIYLAYRRIFLRP
jgi:hypothetical protein